MPQEPKSKEPSIEELEKQAGMGGAAQPTVKGGQEPDISTLESQAADASGRGFWSNLGSDVKGLAMGALSIPQVMTAGPAGFLPVGANMAIHDMMRSMDKTPAPYGILPRSGVPYRALAGVGEGLGVNVPGMEESADKGDIAGVLGHAAAVPAAIAATYGAGALGRLPAVGQAARTGVDLGGKVLADTPILRNITPSKIGEAWRANAPNQPGEVPAYSSDQPASGPYGQATPNTYRARPVAAPAQTAEPIGPRSTLMLPGEVQPVTAYDNVADIRARLGGNPTDPFAGLDKVRAKLTTPEAMTARTAPDASALGGIPASKTSPEVSQSYGLGRIKPAAKPVEPKPSPWNTEPEPKGEVAKPPETPQKPVKEPGKTERQTGYMFGEHAHEVDIGSGTHNEIRAKTYPELVEYANKRGLRGKTDWKVSDFERNVAQHGKSANPNTSYVRGEMAKEAKARPEALKKAPEPKAEEPFNPFDDMAAFQPGRSVHDVLGLKGGVPKETPSSSITEQTQAKWKQSGFDEKMERQNRASNIQSNMKRFPQKKSGSKE